MEVLLQDPAEMDDQPVDTADNYLDQLSVFLTALALAGSQPAPGALSACDFGLRDGAMSWLRRGGALLVAGSPLCQPSAYLFGLHRYRQVGKPFRSPAN